MKRMTGKLYGILILSMLATSAHAGWLSNLGQRIVNGAANTVQTNISGKVNKTIDDVMDGKLTPQKENNGQKSVESQSKIKPSIQQDTVDQNGELVGKVTVTNERGITIKYTGNYERIDLRGMEFTGERIYGKSLLIGEQYKKIDEFLAPGYYVVFVNPLSYQNGIHFTGQHEDEGVFLGYGVVVRKVVFNNDNYYMTAQKGGSMYVVEILPNTQGHMEVYLANNPEKNGQATFTIHKIPGPTLK